MPTYTHTYIHAYIHNYIHTYIPTYLHTYIPTHIATYIHTYILFKIPSDPTRTLLQSVVSSRAQARGSRRAKAKRREESRAKAKRREQSGREEPQGSKGEREERRLTAELWARPSRRRPARRERHPAGSWQVRSKARRPRHLKEYEAIPGARGGRAAE